jgi:selenocysteine-specific elongation factor
MQELDVFHKRFPLRLGMSREELKSRIGLESQIYPMVLSMLSENGLLEVTDSQVARKEYEPELSANQDKLVSHLLARFHNSPYGPPAVRECKDIVGEDLYFFLIEKGQLFQVSPDVVFRHADYLEMVSEIESVLKNRESITVAEVRDLLKTTRKYALALMEHLDSIGVTVRDGDVRRLAIDIA